MHSCFDEIRPELRNLCLKGLDERAIQLVLQKWNKDKSSLLLHKLPKCAKLATEKLNEGNSLFALLPSSTEKLLEIYTEAIFYAPTDSTELSKAYGNRSAVLSNARMYEDSSNDINRALALNYPGNLKATLFVRKARNLLAMSSKNQPEIEEAFADARYWMTKMSNANRQMLETKINKLKTQKSFPEPFQKPDNSIITHDILHPHKTLVDASSAIDLKYSNEFGRHIVATRDIKTGDTLIKQEAYTSTKHIPSDLKIFYCWNCSKRTWACVPCKECTEVVFCDESCRDDGWTNFHDIECPILKQVYSQEFASMGLKATIKAIKQAGSLESLRESVKKLDLVSDPLTRGFVDGQFDGASYASFYTLNDDVRIKFCQEIYIDWACNCVLMLFVWASTSNLFGDDIDNMRCLINNELAIFIGRLLIKNTNICYNNSHVTRMYKKKINISCRTMISGLISCINHSCDSNASLISSGNIMVVNSNRFIKKGEQIFLCYDMIHESRPRFRRYLQERYKFTCKCNICQSELDSTRTLDKTIKGKNLRTRVKELIDKKVMKFYKSIGDHEMSDAECMDRLNTNISYTSKLEKFLDTLIKLVGYPSEHIKKYKEALRLNYSCNST